MKYAVRLLATGSAIAMVMSTHALAADLSPPIEPPVYEVPEQLPAAVSGWYIRGDLGYSWNKTDEIEYITYGQPGYTGTLSGDLKSSFSIGGGIGYQVNSYLRTDLTADYQFETDFEGNTDGVCQAIADPSTDVACRSSDTSSYAAWTVLANAYIDLGTYAGFTPYVGAGIGGAYVEWNGLDNTIGDGYVQSGTTTHGGSSEWRFAYALMVGASYDVSSRLAVDLGYRYKHIKGGRMLQYANFTGPGYDSGITSHEIRAGLRYKFGGHQSASFHPAPIYK